MDLYPGKYILVSAHREENVDREETFFGLMNAINAMAERYRIPVIYSTHPRTKKWIEARQFQFHPLVQNLKPFSYSDYNCLQKNAYCVLSDSGTLSEESAMLRFPCVLIRTSTERPEVLDKGAVIIGGIREQDIGQAIELARSMYEHHEEVVLSPDYQDTNVSVKVIKIIQSYTKIVNEMVWRKKVDSFG